MKKYGKGIALALVFALVFGLFAGLGLYGGSDETMAKAAYTKGANEYLVVEIVPDASVKDDATISSNLTAPSGKTVNVVTCTSATLNADSSSDIADYVRQADLFVIHQSSGKKFSSKDLNWNVVYEIFRKIVGVDGEPAKYIIDKTIFSGESKSKLDWNPRFFTSDGLSGYTGSYVTPYNSDKNVGYSTNAAKLYMMLETMDPGTFYGLFLSGSQTAQYIDKKTGELVTAGPDYNGNPNIQEAAYRFSVWAPKMLVPYYLFNGWSVDGNALTAIGIEITGSDESTDITTGQNYKRGVVYSGNLSGGISSFNSKSFANTTNNGHTYRVLSVAPNKTSGKGSEVALGILKAAKGTESLVGGVKLTAMSMYQLAGDTDKLSDKYDVIYFENGSDSNNNSGWRKALYGTKDNSNTFTVAEPYRRGGSSTAHYAGLDITKKKYDELNEFDKPIIVQKSLKDGSSSWGECYIKTFISGFTASGTSKIIDNSNLNMATVKSAIDASYVLNMKVISIPTLYESNVEFDWYSENGGNGYGNWQDYYTRNLTINDSDRYLKASSGKYYLKFKVDVPSGTTLKLYIDSNNDGRFKESASKTESASGVTDFSYELPGKSGAIYWKLVATNGNKSSYITGCSAIKPGSKQTLNILQIIPLDVNGSDWGNSQDVAATNLILPMKSEIAAAYAATRLNGSVTRGDITQYDIKFGSNSRMMIDSYFNGVMRVQLKGQATDYDHSSYNLVKYGSGTISQSDWQTNDDGNNWSTARPKALLTNAGLFYYFLEKTGAYDLNVLRISSKEFADRLNLEESDATNGKYRIYQDETTGALYYMDPYEDSLGHDPVFVGCDLLMIGGSNRFLDTGDTNYDSASDIAVQTIKKYLEGGQHAYIGGGVMMGESNAALANAIMDVMGFNRYESNTNDNLTFQTKSSQVRNNGGIAEAAQTNTGSMTLYPYAIPTDIRIANSSSTSPYYQLKLDKTDSISVFYAATALSTGKDGFDGLGDVINDYYLYKKGNITFANVGQNHGNMWGQKAYAFKIPEAALLVNAITNTTNPDPNDPPTVKYIVNFVDKKDNSVISAYTKNGNLTFGSTEKKSIEANMPAGYAWKASDTITVKKNNAAVATAVIENAAVASGKLTFKFSDTAGVSAGDYIIAVPVERPDYEIKQRFVGDGPAKNTIIKTDTGVLNAGEKTANITVSLVNDTLEMKGHEIHNDALAVSRYSGSSVTQSGQTVNVVLKDSSSGFDGHYEVIIDVDGPYTPDYANYKIVIKDKNGVVLDADAASGDLTYDSTSSATLDTVTYNTDAYDYLRVETEGGKGTVSASHSSGNVTCTLRDSSGFKNEYVVYVVLDPKTVEQPPIPTIKVENPDKTEYKDGDTDADHDGNPDGIIDTVPSDPSLPPSPNYIPTDPSTGIRYVKYTDYLYPDYETAADGTEKVAESDYLYKNDAGQYVMKVVFSVDLGKDSSGNKVPATIDVQVNDPTDATKRASLELQVYQGDKDHPVTDNKIVADGTTYFVEVPITKAYYQSLATAGKLNGINPNNFGMDNGNDAFGVTIVGTPESGIYGVKTRVNFVKRGMFRID